MSPRICVVGSTMVDQITRAPRLPKPGETVFGTDYRIGFGGKGANQAVIAARLARSPGAVALVAKLGRDTFGEGTLKNLAEQGVSTQFVFFDDHLASGVAPIWVDTATGQNSIIVVPGANDTMTPAEVRSAAPAITASSIVVAQLEIPIPCIIEAFTIARAAGRTTLLNPAPARALPAELLALTDILVPNEPEAETLSGVEVVDADSAFRAAALLQRARARHVMITMGPRGAIALLHDQTRLSTPAPTVTAVDTTGAGDCYIGSFAYFLTAGHDFQTAMRKSAAVAAFSVTRPGTQSSFPSGAEIDGLL